MVSSDIEGFLNDLVLDVSKAALKSHQLDDMHTDESNTEIYLFLYIFFQRAALRQKREDSIASSQAAITAVLRNVLAPALAQSSAPALLKGKGVSSVSQRGALSRQTHDAPMVQQRALREQLQSIRPPSTPNLSAFSEVIEVCRFVDQQLGHPTVFGAVNLLHFVAIFVTLMPHRRLFELIQLVWESTEIPEARRVQVFYIWSVVDRQNREALLELCDHLEARPGLSIPMLLEFFPDAEHINTSKYPQGKHGGTSGVGGSNQRATSSAVTSGRSIVHSESDVGTTTAPVAPPVVVNHDGLDNNDDDGSADDDDGRTDEDRAFWADLVS